MPLHHSYRQKNNYKANQILSLIDCTQKFFAQEEKMPKIKKNKSQHVFQFWASVKTQLSLSLDIAFLPSSLYYMKNIKAFP